MRAGPVVARRDVCVVFTPLSPCLPPPRQTERVSVLFKNHPDLLRDFTYFLPDAVQESVRAAA